MLLLAKPLAVIGYPVPAIRTAVTLSVLPQLAGLAQSINVGMGMYGANYIYSNGNTAYTLLKNIDSELKKIQGYEVTVRALQARYPNNYATKAAYRAQQNLITAANNRIDNYKRQLARLVVYTNPRLPVAPISAMYYPTFAPMRNPYYDAWGRPLFDSLGRPYFDPQGRPFPYTPYYYYR